jgi:hypothetical protein
MTTGISPLVALLGCLALGVLRIASADVWKPLGPMQIDGGRIAPWAAPGTRIDPVYRGKEVRFEAARVIAPPPIACAGAKYEWLFGGAEGLFEGNLPAPAADAARRLGLGDGPFATLRVSCGNAGFDFHRAGNGELLLGLDNVVWTLKPARSATTPAEIVQELLVTHFTHDMAFTRESVARKSAFLGADLRARLAAWFARPQSPDEAPDIDGDPFTNTQEYPDRFTLGPARPTSERTVIPVRFADEHSTRRVDYVLVREGQRWVVDDIVDERDTSVFASAVVLSPDAQSLEQLAKSGDDLSRLHRIEFRLRFPNEEQATEAAVRLEDLAFAATFERDGAGEGWVVIALKRMYPVESDLAGLREKLDVIAAAGGGSYEGWWGQPLP